MAQPPESDRRIDYVEFSCPGIERAREFYSRVFGWTFTEWGSDYLSFEDGRIAGGFRRATEASPGNPLIVLYAAELEATERRVVEAGGEIIREIFEFPGGRRFHFADPCGNLLAVWSEPA